MVKNQKGFTLVEVIVVAVIVAVLAAVAIPLYNGYIKDSRKNVADNLGGTVASACGATIQQNLTPPVAEHVGPTAIDFPGITDGAAANSIQVPDGFTVDITLTTVQATYDKGGNHAVEGELFTYTK